MLGRSVVETVPHQDANRPTVRGAASGDRDLIVTTPGAAVDGEPARGNLLDTSVINGASCKSLVTVSGLVSVLVDGPDAVV
jgi:hypothetical protein